MHLVVRHRRLVWAVAAVTGASVITGVAGGCSSAEDDDPGQRATGVYAELVRWFADARDDDPEPLPVFVEPRGEGTSIPLDVQAALVTEVADVADVRFVDTRDEALTVAEDGSVEVVDGGMLVRLSPVDEISDPVLVEADVHLEDDTFLTIRFEFDQLDDAWVLVGDPEQLSVPTDDG